LTQWYLSAAPIEKVHGEYEQLSLLGVHFTYINMALYIFLDKDKHAESLRALFAPFNGHMECAMAEFGCALRHARGFYAILPDELSGALPPQEVTEKHATGLRLPDPQAWMIGQAREATAHFAAMTRIIRTEVLPRISDLEEALYAFVEGYSTRHRIMKTRAKSWVPSLVQDLLWAGIIRQLGLYPK
jgi:hypothetical protein